MVTLHRGFLRDLECPVCLNYMTSPISMCDNGHSTCGECRPRLQVCSLCNYNFADVRNLALENIIEEIRFCCKNAYNGCTEMFPADQIKNHEVSCLKGPIICPFNKFPNNKCDWVGHIKEFKMHALANPTTHVSIFRNNFLSKANLTVKVLVFVFDEIFLFYKLKNADNWYFIVMMVGNAAQASKYTSIFTLSENNGRNKIVFTADVKHYEEDIAVIINNNDCCEIIGRVAQKFVYENEVHEIQKYDG